MKGEAIYLYAFDVANEIVTSRVQQILSEKPFPFEIRMDRTLPKDIPLYRPLAIEPPPLPDRLGLLDALVCGQCQPDEHPHHPDHPGG